MPSRIRLNNWLNWLLLLALAMLLLAGCAVQQTPRPLPSPTLPEPPPLSTPLPQTPYSETVRSDIENWESKLMGTSLMLGRSSPLGPQINQPKQ